MSWGNWNVTLEDILRLAAAWVVLAIFARPIASTLTVMSETLATILRALKEGLLKARGWIEQLFVAFGERVRHLCLALEVVLSRVLEAARAVAALLIAHMGTVMATVSPDPERRAWRAFGALVYLSALGVFLYADMAQGANNLSTILPSTAFPSWLQNLAIPLVVSSAGTMVTLGVILGDLFGVTHFAPWDHVRGVPKYLVFAMVMITLVLTMFLSSALAFSRVPILLQGQGIQLSSDVVSNIQLWAPIYFTQWKC